MKMLTIRTNQSKTQKPPKANIQQLPINYPETITSRPPVQVEEAPDMNRAFVLHHRGEVPAEMFESTCGSGPNECVHYDNCEIKNFIDEQMYQMLEKGIVPAIDLKFCEHHSPRSYMLQVMKSREQT